MKALVTGGTGFIGSHLVEELIRESFSVTCLVRNTEDLKWLEGYPVRLIAGDCVHRESLKRAVIDCDYIFHLAGLTKGRKKDFYCTNVKGTENLLDAAYHFNRDIKRFVYLSSLAATGPSMKRTPDNTGVVPSPVSEYGKSKLEGEKNVLQYKDLLPITIIRPPAVYGPRDRDFYVVFKMIKKGLFPYWGKSYYSMIYVEDLVRGTIKAIESDKTVGKIYYLSDSRIHTNVDIADRIATELDSRYIKLRIPRVFLTFFANILDRFSRKSIINSDKIKELLYLYWVCNSEEAKRDFGFEPKVDIKDGIRWTANWYRIHDWL